MSEGGWTKVTNQQTWESCTVILAIETPGEFGSFTKQSSMNDAQFHRAIDYCFMPALFSTFMPENRTEIVRKSDQVIEYTNDCE